jgi:hypothetical protein
MLVVLILLRDVALAFSRHLVLVAVLLVIGAIVCARAGRSLGIDRLFWHELRAAQVKAGAATALLFAKVGFVGYLLDAQQLDTLARATGLSAGERALGAILYIALLALPVGCAWALLALLGQARQPAPPKGSRRWFAAGALLGLSASLALLLALAHWLPRYPETPGWVTFALGLEQVPAALRPLHALAGVFMLGLSAEYVVYAVTRDTFTPAMAICTLLGLLAGAEGFLEFRDWNASAIAAGVAFALALGGRPHYKNRIWALRALYADPIALDGTGTSVYPQVRSETIPWREPDGARRPLVLVCASGGGLRAALWTAEVLAQLELSLPGFARNLRMISGASGGMFGASAYALSLREGSTGEPWQHTLSREELIERIGRDSLSAAVKRLVFRDLPMAALPRVNLRSRGEALERAWLRQLGEPLQRTFGELAAREQRGEAPSLVFSPMLVEDGRRLLISNLELDFVARAELPSTRGDVPLTRAGFELARLLPEAFGAFPVRTAARLSAAFPYVSPAVVLPTRPRRRVVDAGYYDNYGVSICAAFLFECLCRPALRAWLEQNVARVLVVQIRDAVSSLRGIPQQERVPGLVARGLEELASPLQAVFSARQGVSAFRNDEQIAQVLKLYCDAFGSGFIRTEILEFPGAASLSWYLTHSERSAISQAARGLEPQLEPLRRFWQGRPEADQPVAVHAAAGAEAAQSSRQLG